MTALAIHGVTFSGNCDVASVNRVTRILGERASWLAHKRNHIVHGFYMQFDEESQKAVFLKFKAYKSDDTYRGEHLKITIDELEKLRHEAAALATCMTDLASRITQVLFGDPELILDFGPA